MAQYGKIPWINFEVEQNNNIKQKVDNSSTFYRKKSRPTFHLYYCLITVYTQ